MPRWRLRHRRQSGPARGRPVGRSAWRSTPAVAPRFTARHPRAAAIFDNLHMMHDIISDILVSDRVPRNLKGKAIEAALAEFRDSTRNTKSVQEWPDMAAMTGGVDRLGGVAWTPPVR